MSELVSVIVCTRNRGANVITTVRSVLACSYENLELLLLDQSDADDTRQAVAPIAEGDSRLVYCRLEVPGKPLALNVGRAAARGAYVLLTDDDCEVTSDWIDRVLAEFREHPEVGCVFGRVDAVPHDPSTGYVPVCLVERAKTIRRLDELLTMPGWGNFGMGANMSLRADALEVLHGWDECIGPGAKFGSGDDHDVAVRMLRAGYAIRFSPEAKVVHSGMRHWEAAGRDYRRIWYGVGGVFAKHLRTGVFYPGGLRVPLYQVRDSTFSLLKGAKPRGVTYIGGWLRGFFAGLRHPVDRQTQRFVPIRREARRYADRVAEIVLRGNSPPNSGQDN